MRILFVAISGGHLAQLRMLEPRLMSCEPFWVTDRTPQSESLLSGETVNYLPTRPPRDWSGVIRDTTQFRKILVERKISHIVSTGSQIALSAYFAGRTLRLPFAYVESATRVTGLSTTGKVLDRLPCVRRYVQHEENVSARWTHRMSVFDGFCVKRVYRETVIPRKIVVTLGGNGEYAFPRLIMGVKAILPPGSEVLWQLGNTDTLDLPGRVVDTLSSAELDSELRSADVVIGHAGTGTALGALRAGRLPILIPRSPRLGEHVDGHQDDLAASLAKRGLAIIAKPDELTLDMLAEAALYSVEHQKPSSQIDLFDNGS